jgi:hypothetical protein
MNRDQIMLGSAGSFVVGLGLLFGSKHLGPVAGAAALLGVGFLGLAMIGIFVARIMRVVSFFKR